jgi:hypothetical protein
LPLLDGDERLQTAWPLDLPELTAKLQTLMALRSDERQTIGMCLRTQIIAQHSLSALMKRLTSILETGEA